MDERPIGVFDSGLGGLTTVKRLTQLLPEESIIYLGDTGRVPYGSRSKETIVKYTRQAAEFLVGHDIKALVIACNTACSSAFEMIDDLFEIPVYEVITAPAIAASNCTKNGKIGVIGTYATIRSGAYEAAIKKQDPALSVYSVPCPLFVPLVENGRTGPEDIAALDIAEEYLAVLRNMDIDTLILGCTHYPLLRNVISKVVGQDVMLIDSGSETAGLVAEDIFSRKMNAMPCTEGTIRFFVTDSIEGFSSLASRYMEADISTKVEQITLEQ